MFKSTKMSFRFLCAAMLLSIVTSNTVQASGEKASFFGLQIQGMTPAIATALGLDDPHGVMVRDIAFPGPASKSDIHRGDVIVELDGKPVQSVNEITKQVQDFKPGMSIPVQVWRRGKSVDINITLSNLPARWAIARNSFSTIPALGLTFASLTDKVQQRFDVAWNTRGVAVSLVDKEKSAGLDLKVGDVVVQVNQSDVWTPAHIVSYFKKAQKENKEMVVLLVARNNGYRFVLLPVPVLN